MSIAEKIQTIAENVPKVYDAGKQAQHNDFWDKYLNGNGAVITSVSHMNKFSGAAWNDNTFYPTKDLKVGYGEKWFLYSRITNLKQRLIDCGVKFDFSGTTNLGCFFESSSITEIPEIDLTNITTASGANRLCYGCGSLVTIDKIITKDIITYANNFAKCWALRNVLFEGSIGQSIDFKDSGLLTTKSIVSIVEHLNNAKTGLTLTLSQTAVSAMTFPFNSEQSGYQYRDWETLIGTKWNWTISLV